MLIRKCFLSVLTVVATAVCGAAAQTPYERSGAAIVIFIDAASQPNIQPFDELQAGRRIDLNADETLELGYFDSCVMEAITGGAVTVGARESRVDGGAIQRETVDCANMRFQHGVAQLQFAAAAVFEKTAPGGTASAVTGSSDVASWSGAGPAVPDQLDVLVGPLLAEVEGRRRIAVLPVTPEPGVVTREAAEGARLYLLSRLRAETDHSFIAGDQFTGLQLAPGDVLEDDVRRRLRTAGAEVVILCTLDAPAGEVTLGCQGLMVDGDHVVGHGAVVLSKAPVRKGGTTAIVE